jgi:ABC-type multidrug transport system fused ATPase/permease subunit
MPSGPTSLKGGVAERAPSFGANLRMIWRLRSHFAVYLLPALGLLLLALLQADLALTATTAGQRVIDTFAARAVEEGAPAAPFVASSQTFSEQLFNVLSRGAGPLGLAFFMALFLVLAQGLGIFIEQVRTSVNEHFRYRLQAKLLRGFASELASTRGLRSSGNNSQIFTTDASQLSGLLIFGLVGALENVVKLGVYAYGLTRIQDGWVIVAVALPITVIFQTVVTTAFGGRESRAIERSEGLNVQMRSQATEFFDVLARLVYFRGDRSYSKRLLDLSRASANASREFQLVSSIQGSVMGVVTTLSLPLVIVLLSLPVMVAAVGEVGLTAGTIVQAQALLMLLTSTTGALIGIPSNLTQASPSIRRVEEVLSIPDPGDEPETLAELRSRQTPPSLEVSDLTFAYRGANQPLLRALDFAIPPGACVGVIAGSGGGKSTLARILIGDLRPTAGRILYDGVDVTDWHLWHKRDLIGFLPAEQGFVRGTLEENVLFGRSLGEVHDYERALEVSGVANIARGVADRGGMQMYIDARVDDFLSTGERRRVGIARLLLGDQRLWIFDEPGSGLDSRTMGDIARALAPGSPAMSGRTSIIITHDADVFRTDFNIFIENGAVSAIGPHEELLQRSNAYQKLVTRYARERDEPLAKPAAVGAPPEGAWLERKG